jgi:hypothetical protein
MQRLGMMFQHNAVQVMAAACAVAVLWLAVQGLGLGFCDFRHSRADDE